MNFNQFCSASVRRLRDLDREGGFCRNKSKETVKRAIHLEYIMELSTLTVPVGLQGSEQILESGCKRKADGVEIVSN